MSCASVIYSVTNLMWTTTRSRGSRQVDCKCRDFILSHYPRKWFVRFWTCDLISLTRCCKLMSFFLLYLIFAVLLANIKRPVPVWKKIICASVHSAFTNEVEYRNWSLARVILKIVCQKLYGPRDLGHAPCGENYLLWLSSEVPNLTTLAQVF